MTEADDSNLYGNTITNNKAGTGKTGGIYVTGKSEGVSLAGDPCEGTYNIIWGNDGYQLCNANPFNASGIYDIDARYVQWGTSDPWAIQEGILDHFDNGSLAFVIWSPTEIPGLICSDTTWDLAGSPYVIAAGASVVIGCDATLTIEPGVLVKFEPRVGIVVGSASFGGGTLVARGTEESPIIFTSVKDPCDPCDPAGPGDWTGIHFTDYGVDANVIRDGNDVNYVSGCILEHVIQEYAGHGMYGNNYPAIFAEQSTVFMNCCEVRHNSACGIYHLGSSQPAADAPPPMNIVNCEVWDNGQRGIRIEQGWEHYLRDNNIHHNSRGGIYFEYSGWRSPWTASWRLDSATVVGNIITYNGYSDTIGGGIRIDDCEPANIIGNTISHNDAGSGGGIYVYCWCSWDPVTLIAGNVITNNTVSGSSGRGGGVVLHLTDAELRENTISGNTTEGDGGASTSRRAGRRLQEILSQVIRPMVVAGESTDGSRIRG